MDGNAKMGNFECYPELTKKSIENDCQQSIHLGVLWWIPRLLLRHFRMRDAAEFL